MGCFESKNVQQPQPVYAQYGQQVQYTQPMYVDQSMYAQQPVSMCGQQPMYGGQVMYDQQPPYWQGQQPMYAQPQHGYPHGYGESPTLLQQQEQNRAGMSTGAKVARFCSCCWRRVGLS